MFLSFLKTHWNVVYVSFPIEIPKTERVSFQISPAYHVIESKDNPIHLDLLEMLLILKCKLERFDLKDDFVYVEIYLEG